MASRRSVCALLTNTLRLSTRQSAQETQTLRQLITRRSLSSSSQSPIITQSMVRLRQPKRHFTTTLVARKQDDSTASAGTSSSSSSGAASADASAPPKLYTFEEIKSITSQADPNRILIDVREPHELKQTGKIPGSRNLPVQSAADAFFLPAEEFEERFGFEKPDANNKEVIFYCKAGVRSRAAAQLAQRAGWGGKIAEFPGSWIEWEKNGGEIEKLN
ncbi:hypothetical protein ABEF91_008154 [Exophiala dermatitidis]